MSSPLYDGKFVAKKGAVVQYRLTIIHPDVSDFGTDAYFAWKLLSDWVSPEEHDDDDVSNAKRFIKSVKLSKVENATVDRKEKDFFTVKRKGKKDPSVVYTITVTDAALLKDIKVGDGDEVYQYVEPGAGAKKPAKKPAAAKGKKGAAPAVIEPKTFDDVRRTALALIESNQGTWSDYIVERYLLGWSRGAPDADVREWLSHLDKSWQICGAALVGLQRQQDGKVDAAKEWRSFAEKLLGAKPGDDLIWRAYHAMPALWWRLGDTKKADEAFASFRKKLIDSNNTGARQTLISVAALGGRADLVDEMLPEAFKEGSYGADYASLGLVSALERGEEKISTAILARWAAGLGTERRDACSELSLLLVRSFRDEPKRFLDLLLGNWRVISDWYGGAFALRELERRDPKQAAALAPAILDNTELYSLHEQAAAVLAAHEPAKAEAWAAKNPERAGTPSMLAAMGKDAEARAALKKKRGGDVASLATVSSDPATAIEAWKAGAVRYDDPNPDALRALVDLGERAYVDELLAKSLASAGKLEPKKRDLRCRALAAAAATVGRADIGFAACKLPTNAVRRYSAGDLCSAAAKAGDYGVALAALELVPDGDANGRVSSAVQGGVRGAEEAPFTGSGAVPLRIPSTTYAKSLIARGDRAAVEWLVVATKGKLPNDAQVEIDAFLEKAAPARASG